MNNKGFAITTILYALLIIFCMLLVSLLGILSSYRNNLEKLMEYNNGARDILTKNSNLFLTIDTSVYESEQQGATYTVAGGSLKFTAGTWAYNKHHINIGTIADMDFTDNNEYFVTVKYVSGSYTLDCTNKVGTNATVGSMTYSFCPVAGIVIQPIDDDSSEGRGSRIILPKDNNDNGGTYSNIVSYDYSGHNPPNGVNVWVAKYFDDQGNIYPAADNNTLKFYGYKVKITIKKLN